MRDVPFTSGSLLRTPLLAGLLACSSSGAGAPVSSPLDAPAASGLPGTLADAQIEAAAATFKGFAKIDKAAYPTRQHAGNPLVDVYANGAAEATYRGVDFGAAPDGPVAFAPGAILVKAMLDPSGAPPILTVMYKKTPGYDPTHGDWWYGRLNSDGSPTDPSFVGTVSFCVGCHTGAAATDYAWGIVPANK